MIEIMKKAVAMFPLQVPAEWNEHVVLQVDGMFITVSFRNGKVFFDKGKAFDPTSVVQLSCQRICNIIDGSIDYMTVWRELAEPSPTDRTYILQGNGAKLFVVLDGITKCYSSNGEFKKILDSYKMSL